MIKNREYIKTAVIEIKGRLEIIAALNINNIYIDHSVESSLVAMSIIENELDK